MSDIYGVILAGGVGRRMGNIDRPKQFLELAGKPILIHTVEKFLMISEFEQVLVLAPQPWIAHTSDLIRRYIPEPDRSRVAVTAGGETRNETIMNAIRYIEQEGRLNDDTLIVTHDAVRPFLTRRIIEENIRYASECGACDTVIPASDTIVESTSGDTISNIPNRAYMYQGQTPQSFRAKKLREVYESMTEEEKSILTDACKIMVIKGERVRLVMGDVTNIKITHPSDIRFAEALAGGLHAE